ncbi:hypothetical protein BKA93DRAFT_824712 [Sparassis latifolia]|uniref:Protein RTA1 n=1 Tax=Sparassis crispa TaxID=139825 RepID=A0A401GD17_9APHY|nr:hypothetical protein SCP_0212810 [Sparassis crispa]GBE80078.1 hypothetical protein SCP_0212810 [Sparassis crispa]
MVNYAQLEGIHSLTAAIIFAIIYVPLLAFYLFKSVRRPTYVHLVLSFFCLVRIVAFSLRAALAGSTSAGSNLNLYIAAQILYNVGFFGVLYSSYTLVLDRELLADTDGVLAYAPGPVRLVVRISRDRHLIRIILLVAIVLGIVGATKISSGSSAATINSGETLRSSSIYIFISVASLLAFQTIVLAISDIKSPRYAAGDSGYGFQASFGAKYGVFVLLIVSILLLLREAFFAATAHNLSQQNNEHLWYPLAALSELLAVMLIGVPGLVPARSELPKQESIGMVRRFVGRGNDA